MSTIHELPEEQRPREKLAKYGAQALTDPELLAIFLRVGVKGYSAIDIGKRLIQTYGGLSQLSRLDLSDLAKEHGLGIAKAAQLCASFEIANRIAKESMRSAPIHSPDLIYAMMAPQLRLQHTEGLYVLLADTQLNHIRTITISKGTINQTTCHPRDVIRPAIQQQAYGFALVHNHPSGNPSPSHQDDAMTNKILSACDLMQIRFLDHIIIGQSIDGRAPYYSYRQQEKL